jgi:phosphoenolpyruvate---glycerone phosphotransferase subunit DhaL
MFDVLERWLRLSADRIREQAPALTALDQAIGDGDHGINLDRGFTAIVAQLDAGRPEADGARGLEGALLRTAGRTLISTVGGAAGPLFGTAFVRAGNTVAAVEPALAPADVLLAALEAAIGGIAGLGKATMGEKTMLDAMVPALRAGQSARGDGADGPAVARALADAAEAGAIATVPMLATKGRASYLGERSIGHQDPGATSSALLLRALADAIAAG